MSPEIKFPIYKSFWVDPDHRELFKSHELISTWSRSYPFLFDERDIQIAEKQAHLGYHYYEWLAAILIFHTEGLYSLVEQYQFDSHKRKREILEKLTTPEIIAFMQSHPDFGGAQCPDLLVYQGDFSEWFFVEVKGPRDKLSKKQIPFFERLVDICGKAVKVVEFRPS